MKALLIILICLGVVLAVLAFFTDVRIPLHTHTASAQSDGTTAGTRVTASRDETTEIPVRSVARIALALDIAASIVVAVLLTNRSHD